ncbi:pilus assembly protein [Steroidobacter agaridevorans]|uniref:pilus assembly protein n=1 Tax=Steroidobacter agaridevorans TaxID=2695856 RepID=UPI0013206CEB|nr:PilC/PilY family type IV pilus protein [Steroidobacter agaridevorans]GFE87936.1 type IV pili system adhesin PilY [Steroidobacter agaridevorans]
MNRPIQWTSSHLRSWVRLLTCGCVTAGALLGTARADDSEIYIAQSTAAPNIMLILDTSGSMQGEVTTQAAYDPNTDYIAKATGDCANISNRVFFTTENDDDDGDGEADLDVPPTCDTNRYVAKAVMNCASATDPLKSEAGSYTGDRFVQWRTGSRGSDRQWRNLRDGYHTTLDCKNDGADYPDRNGSGSTDTAAYTSVVNNSFWYNEPGKGVAATLFSANYVAYYHQFRTSVLGTRLSVMQQAARKLLNSVTNVNVGLMRYSINVQWRPNRDTPYVTNGGGMVLEPVAPIAQNRDRLITAVNGLIPYGSTPLSETLFEAHQYFAGGAVTFGKKSQICSASTPTGDGTTTNCSGTISTLPSVATSISGDNYISPATQECQKNYIVYLTDGQPTSDTKANDAIKALPGFTTEVPGSCGTGDGVCLGALSEYMFDKDLRGVVGKQNVTTFYIGFGEAFGSDTSNEYFQYLADAAARGGGSAYQAGDLAELSKVFTNIFSEISTSSATMTAPTVAVNAFNRTQTLNDLYISVFKPSPGIHWPGNIKKYTIDPSDDRTLKALGSAGTAVNALASDGTFAPNTKDYWQTDPMTSATSDSAEVELGGAAHKIPTPASRKLYTYLGDNPSGSTAGVALTGTAQAVAVGNDAITRELLGVAADTATTSPRADLINWARGADIDDEDEDNDKTEQRYDIGDPMHSQPAVVIYGGTKTAKNQNDAVVFTATNDGYLHAFSTATGEERWAFIPKEMLGGLKRLYLNESLASKNYSIDGDLRVLKYDVNSDGIVTPADNDRVLLFFSTGRNPTVSRYYALDVTDKDAPRFLWSIGADVLQGLGQAWSRPTITRVNIDGPTQNSQKLVLIFGGGYDATEEGGAYVAEAEAGNRVFMVDALRGTLLWSAGDAGTDLDLPRMKHAIPAPVNVVDLDGDSFADRMYVGDMAAQLWRFDIYNGKAPADLVTGGVLASLGAKDASTKNAANTRRFYNSPDASLMQGKSGRPFINVAIGSGYRGHPLSTSNEDRFYSVRDYQPFTKLTKEQYAEVDIVLDSELEDITTNFAPQLNSSSPGWKLRMNTPSATGKTVQGEKVLSSSSTLQNTIFFTTYLPEASATSNTCSPAKGSNRAYAVSALDGTPLPRRDGSTGGGDGGTGGGSDTPSTDDRFTELDQTGIAPEVTVLFPEKDKITCLSGVEVLDVCKDFDSRIKTYWLETNAN